MKMKFNTEIPLQKVELVKHWILYMAAKTLISYRMARLPTPVKIHFNKKRKSIENDSPVALEDRKDLLTIDELITQYDPTVNDQPISYLTRRQYTIDEDIFMLTLKNQSEKMTYKEMAEMFVDRTLRSLKQRFYYFTKV